MKGIAIGENEHIRKVHNSFKTQEPFESDERMATSKDDVTIFKKSFFFFFFFFFLYYNKN